jgi:hypothetical protein
MKARHPTGNNRERRMVIPDEHGIDRFMEFDIDALVDAACIAPCPVIPRITSSFAE